MGKRRMSKKTENLLRTDIQSLSAMFPLRYYYLIYVDQALNGWSLQYSAQYYAILLIFILLPLTDVHRIKHSMLNYEYLP